MYILGKKTFRTCVVEGSSREHNQMAFTLPPKAMKCGIKQIAFNDIFFRIQDMSIKVRFDFEIVLNFNK